MRSMPLSSCSNSEQQQQPEQQQNNMTQYTKHGLQKRCTAEEQTPIWRAITVSTNIFINQSMILINQLIKSTN
jgi:hypothetical protein